MRRLNRPPFYFGTFSIGMKPFIIVELIWARFGSFVILGKRDVCLY